MAAADLAAGVPHPEVGPAGAVTGALQVVDLDAGLPAADLPAALGTLSLRTGLVVGVARRPLLPAAQELAAALDLTLTAPGCGEQRWAVEVDDPAAALTALDAQVSAAPRAALVLAALLRATELLPLTVGLAMEAAAYSTLLAGPEHQAWLAARGPGRPLEGATERVRLAREGDVLHVRLARPVRRNAVDARMREALLDALDVALADPRVVVDLRADGPVFSAGGDLDEFGTTPDPATAWTVRTTRSPARSIAQLGDRLTAHVHGACAGAGVELPAFAGRLTADPGTTFRLPELTMGLLPGAGGTVSLPQRVGRWRTAWLALSGKALDAPAALRWGLVDDLAP